MNDADRLSLDPVPPIDPAFETGSHAQATRQMAVSPNSGASRLNCGAKRRQDAKEDISLGEFWLTIKTDHSTGLGQDEYNSTEGTRKTSQRYPVTDRREK